MPLLAVKMHCQAVISTAKASNKDFTFIYYEVATRGPSIYAGLRTQLGRFNDQPRIAKPLAVQGYFHL